MGTFLVWNYQLIYLLVVFLRTCACSSHGFSTGRGIWILFHYESIVFVHFDLVLLLLGCNVFLNELVSLHVLSVSMVVADVTANTVTASWATNPNRVPHAQAAYSLNTITTFGHNLLGLELINWDAREISTNWLFHFKGLVLVNDVSTRVGLFHGRQGCVLVICAHNLDSSFVRWIVVALSWLEWNLVLTTVTVNNIAN